MAVTIVATASGAVGTSSAAVTFSSYTPQLNDLILCFMSSTSSVSAAADSGGWVNVQGSANETTHSAMGMIAAYHFVTSGEVSAVTTTYDPTVIIGSETGYNHALALRGVDTTTPIDGWGNDGTASTSASTPHVLAGITGSGVLISNSLVISSVAKDATGAYSSTPAGWTQQLATNTTQGRWTGTRDTLTTLNTDVTATNITPSAADEFLSITVAITASVAAGTDHPVTQTDPLGLTDSVAFDYDKNPADLLGITEDVVLATEMITTYGADQLGLTDSAILSFSAVNQVDQLGFLDSVALEISYIYDYGPDLLGITDIAQPVPVSGGGPSPFVLNDALAIYLGATFVERVYVGTDQVWP